MSSKRTQNPPAGGDEGREKPRGMQRLRAILREIVFLGVLVLLVLTARASLADHYYVPSGSMRPTVEKGDHLVVNKLAFGLRIPRTTSYIVPGPEPRRGDVVVLSSPLDGTVLLKRVVAVPGDVIRVDSSGRLHLNGRSVEIRQEYDNTLEILGEAPHTVRLTSNPIRPYGPKTLPEDQYLVLGDNRGESQDGRNFGLVERDSILGRGIAIYWREGRLTWERFH